MRSGEQRNRCEGTSSPVMSGSSCLPYRNSSSPLNADAELDDQKNQKTRRFSGGKNDNEEVVHLRLDVWQIKSRCIESGP
jgi:hypothetical protein